ncbi:hypothetical protein [Gemmobacter denitrificans]|uniref:Anti-sigma factor NepR domain-containing protein n=1 Tax=Gemmobacter denitrificans TaxID=3123040 RepID=A0ABU8BUY3_9RHOB
MANLWRIGGRGCVRSLENNQAKESDFTMPSIFVTFAESQANPPRVSPDRPNHTRGPIMKANPPGPFAKPAHALPVHELLRQTLEGLMPVTPDLSALLDRMEMQK